MKSLKKIYVVGAVFLALFISIAFPAGNAAAMDGQDGEVIEGKIQGLSYITNQNLYPRDAYDPLVSAERAFVLVKGDDRKNYFFLPNLNRSFVSRFVGKEVMVTGNVHFLYGRKSIDATEIKTLEPSGWKSIWSKKSDKWKAWRRNRDLNSH